MGGPTRVFEHGMGRLLADHCVLKYRLEVALWSLGPVLTEVQREAVIKDTAETGLGIDCIGLRVAEIGGTHPQCLSTFPRLVSLTCEPFGNCPLTCLKSLQTNHREIAQGIELLDTLVFDHETTQNRRLLCDLLDLHVSSVSRLSDATAE